jgi:thiamine-monophosphate kinase
MKTLSGIGEFAWLKKLLPRLYWPASLRSQLCIGPGDDAGVLRVSRNKLLVATTDTMVEGIHFDQKWFSWHDLGEKILAVNLSDLAAMGAVKPLAALVTASFPGDTPVDDVDKFYKGLESCAQRWKTGLLGGDTVGSRRDWFVSITVLGEARAQDLVRRGGAKTGDYIASTGSLGLAGAGLEILQKGKQGLAWTKPLVEAFCRPQPRFDAGKVLGAGHLASSLIDSSDGLEASVRLMAEASGLGVEISLPDLPVSPALKRWAEHMKRPAWGYILRGGEDYELIFTVNPRQWARVKKALPHAKVIGRMLAKGESCWAVAPDGRKPLSSYGYSHF